MHGNCVHPVTGGSGSFRKAAGVIFMEDMPTGRRGHDDLHGHDRVPGAPRAAQRRQAPDRCASASAGAPQRRLRILIRGDAVTVDGPPGGPSTRAVARRSTLAAAYAWRRVYDYRILGSLEAYEGDRVVALGGARCRAVLAVLVDLRESPRLGGPPGRRGVGRSRSGERRQRRAGARLGSPARARPRRDRDARRRLRAARGETAVATSTASSSCAARGSEALRDGRHEEASAAFAEALALWRGPALAEIADGGMLVAEALRLDEMRLHALEQRIEADLAARAPRRARRGAARARRRASLREPLRAHLAVALYRAGRQVEALEVLREARRSLADELGLEPSPRLQELERAILQHDPAARRSRRRAGAGARPGRARSGRSWSRSSVTRASTA